MNPKELYQLKKLNPCAEGLAWAKQQPSLAAAWESCECGEWMFWYLENKNILTSSQAIEIAIRCAKRVLPLFEKKYPKDGRPRKALNAAQDWLKKPIDKNKQIAKEVYISCFPYSDYAACAASAAAASAVKAAASTDLFDIITSSHQAIISSNDAVFSAFSLEVDIDAKYSRVQKNHADIIRSIVKNPFRSPQNEKP